MAAKVHYLTSAYGSGVTVTRILKHVGNNMMMEISSQLPQECSDGGSAAYSTSRKSEFGVTIKDKLDSSGSLVEFFLTAFGKRKLVFFYLFI